MAILRLYAIIDNEAGMIAGPLVMHPRDAAAIRQFTELLQDKNTMPGKYPQHFDLLALGEIETDTGAITPHEPLTIVTGLQWLEHNHREDDITASLASAR